MNLNTPVLHDLARMLLVYAHVIACSVAIGFAFFADFRILRSGGAPRPRDVEVVRQVVTFVTGALIVLWMTGAAITVLDFGHFPSLNELLQKPKLTTKLFVVSVVTLNGALLHSYALPRMNSINLASTLIGGVSASSWMFAAFLGVGKPLATLLSQGQFLALYALVLWGGLSAAALIYYVQASANRVPPARRPALQAELRQTLASPQLGVAAL